MNNLNNANRTCGVVTEWVPKGGAALAAWRGPTPVVLIWRSADAMRYFIPSPCNMRRCLAPPYIRIIRSVSQREKSLFPHLAAAAARLHYHWAPSGIFILLALFHVSLFHPVFHVTRERGLGESVDLYSWNLAPPASTEYKGCITCSIFHHCNARSKWKIWLAAFPLVIDDCESI